jgi:hypothetical protein
VVHGSSRSCGGDAQDWRGSVPDGLGHPTILDAAASTSCYR